ncbi:MAG: hypothetical protein MJE68_21420, partial [Proteobacteria bacterium]|nr:hypothetical protein [Pseudomonadota bacterium]
MPTDPITVNRIDDTQAAPVSQDNLSSINGTSDQPGKKEQDIEAQLALSATHMNKKFASLVVSIIDSFKCKSIHPRDLATTVLELTQRDRPLRKKHVKKLKEAKTIDDTFDVLRPYNIMSFFNYEILEFLIEKKGLEEDKVKLKEFLKEFTKFCKQSVFEIPSTMLRQNEEEATGLQKFCVKITKQFKAASISNKKGGQQATSSCPIKGILSRLWQRCPIKGILSRLWQRHTLGSTSSNQEERERICAPELDISLEDAKHIQRKVASALNLNTSSVYLDSIGFGSVILTFLLPSHISLAV